MALFHLVGPGAVDDPCNDLFAGPEPLSEPETAQYAAEVTSHSNIIALVSIHTFDWSWLLPYGSEDENGNCERDEDYDDLVSRVLYVFSFLSLHNIVYSHDVNHTLLLLV